MHVNISSAYQTAFGCIHTDYQPDPAQIKSLLPYAGKQPDATVDNNTYASPASRLERWKWIAGLENELDREVQQNYDKQIELLEYTQATSIIQLKNQMIGFWHADRQIKDYVKLKTNAAKGNLITKTFFVCLGFLLRLCYRPADSLYIGKKLEYRSKETFATIGGFRHNNQNYDVVAFHPLADENTQISIENQSTDFKSFAYTNIGILKSEEPHHMAALYDHGHMVSMILGRECVNPGRVFWIPGMSTENDGWHVRLPVHKNKRHLKTLGLKFRDGTDAPKGSDRPLDQRLTQIMIEMLEQNDGISLKAVAAESVVLVAGGFKGHCREKQMQALDSFRSDGRNNLFPPVLPKRLSCVDDEVWFDRADISQPNVNYSREAPQTWSDRIKKESILKPGAGILPEYWVNKPIH